VPSSYPRILSQSIGKQSPLPPPAATILSFAVVPSCALGPSAAATARDGSRLALFKPANQWLRQGTPNRISLLVQRTGFRDAVEVNFLNLPKGVHVDDKVIPEGLTAKDFVLVAGTDAEIVAAVQAAA